MGVYRNLICDLHERFAVRFNFSYFDISGTINIISVVTNEDEESLVDTIYILYKPFSRKYRILPIHSYF